MYPLENIYSQRSYLAWRETLIGPDSPKLVDRRQHKISQEPHIDLRDYRESWHEIRNGSPWVVHNWGELRTAISYLSLMNKRHVLYFRGQHSHYDKCLPTLLREKWHLNGQDYVLTSKNRKAYYSTIHRDLTPIVLRIAQDIGTPRVYILKHVPAATASILQHYELWPTHFIDITRSLPTAVSFAAGNRNREEGYLYVFAMPDLRGSITSDMDQHLTLSRLEAICPPDAIRPHHQDAYLVSRFPEPASLEEQDDGWNDWIRKTDLMRRVVAKFKLVFTNGILDGSPTFQTDFLIPPLELDEFGARLIETILPSAESFAQEFSII